MYSQRPYISIFRRLNYLPLVHWHMHLSLLVFLSFVNYSPEDVIPEGISVSLKSSFFIDECNNNNNNNNNNNYYYYYYYYYLRIYYQWMHIFQCIKFCFIFPFFCVDPFHVVDSFLSHSSCNFLHPWISRSSFSSSSSSSSSSRWTPFQNFSR